MLPEKLDDKLHYDHLYKIVLIGNSSVGKTSLIQQFTENIFEEDTNYSIGIDFKLKTIIANGKRLKLQIWDTAGQERFRSLTTHYYRGTNAFFFIYDITNWRSFMDLQFWLDLVNGCCSNKVLRLVIGNKVDVSDKRKVSYTDGEEFSRQNQCHFFEVSARSVSQVNAIFSTVGSKIYLSQLYDNHKMEDREPRVKLESKPPARVKPKRKFSCEIL